MLQSIYTALSGMSAQQYNIDIIGNNLANVDTASFKSGRVDFADALYAQMQRTAQSGANLQQGSGMFVGAVQRDPTAGVGMLTGSTLDFMLDGAGYFAVQGPMGVCYTRTGSFRASMRNGIGTLVTAEGYTVLGADNQRILLPGDALYVKADAAGNLSFNGVRFATMKTVTFANPAGLLDVGGNKYQPSAASGAIAACEAPVRQGWLEGSNVEMISEMTRLTRAQRAYTALGTAIRTADEMESLANNMGK
jgi:flagellar basal-body rod protein FlgG